jgi:hypothetical protein
MLPRTQGSDVQRRALQSCGHDRRAPASSVRSRAARGRAWSHARKPGHTTTVGHHREVIGPLDELCAGLDTSDRVRPGR